MGITFVDIKVTNPAKPKKAKVFEFLVDSGALYTVIPRDELKKLGIKPSRQEDFILANGEKVNLGVGNAFFEFQGKVGAAPVVFGDEGIYLLGATALESVGLILDPLRRELKPAPMFLMAQCPVKEHHGSLRAADNSTAPPDRTSTSRAAPDKREGT